MRGPILGGTLGMVVGHNKRARRKAQMLPCFASHKAQNTWLCHVMATWPRDAVSLASPLAPRDSVPKPHVISHALPSLQRLMALQPHADGRRRPLRETGNLATREKPVPLNRVVLDQLPSVNNDRREIMPSPSACEGRSLERSESRRLL